MASAYADLLSLPRIRVPLAASVVGRLPIGASALATLLLVQSTTGSFASAGIVEAFYAVGLAVGLPQLGRMVDRDGHTRTLVVAATLESAALVVLVVAAHGGAGVGSMSAIALIAGATTPPLGLCMRGLWSAALDDEVLLQSAFAIESVIVEIVFICGPLLAGGVTAAASPSAAVLVVAALSLVGPMAFAGSEASRAWRGVADPPDRHWAAVLRSPGIRVIAAASACFGLGQGILEVTLTAFGSVHGSAAIAGPMLSIQAAASLAAGFWYGSRRWESDPAERFVRLNALLALGFAPLALAGSVGALAALMILPGLGLAPVTATCYVLINRAAPAGRSTEAFGWSITATVAGAGLGAAIGGAIVNGGHVSGGFLAAFVAVALAAAVAYVRRQTLASTAFGG